MKQRRKRNAGDRIRVGNRIESAATDADEKEWARFSTAQLTRYFGSADSIYDRDLDEPSKRNCDPL